MKISKSPQEGTHILILPSRRKSLNETKEIFIEHYMSTVEGLQQNSMLARGDAFGK